MEDDAQEPFSNKLQSILKNKKALLIAAGGLTLLVIIAVIIFTQVSPQENSQPITDNEEEYNSQREKLLDLTPPQSLIFYGAATSTNTEIYAYQLSTAEEFLLTKLPLDIKTINILNNKELLYLAETNELDYGKELVVHNLENNTNTIEYSAIENYGIDMYLISPDKKRITTWEIQAGPQGIMQGGKSRIVTFSLGSAEESKTIVEQDITSTDPIYYPVLITNDGKIFLDTFLPNSGTGWAYGMSVADAETGTITPIPQMTNGTYSTRPIASPDGTFIAFAGYNGEFGDGAQSQAGVRRALIYANTLEVLDTTTLRRETLPNLPNGNTYLRVSWGEAGNTLIYAALNEDIQVSEFSYHIERRTNTQINTDPNIITLAKLGSQGYLQGAVSQNSNDFVSNLGSNITYQSPYENLLFLDLAKESSTDIPLTTPLIQYINTQTVTSSPQVQQDQASIQSLGGRAEDLIIDFGEKINWSSRQLQLKTILFPTKPVGQEREEVVNDPLPTPTTIPSQPTPPESDKPVYICDDISTPICLSKFGVDKESNIPIAQRFDFLKCQRDLNVQFKAEGKCLVCPLYIYGPQGLEVDVKFHTKLSNTNIQPTADNYSLKLTQAGKFTVEGKEYENISADVSSARTVKPPRSGKVVSRENVTSTIKEFAQKLELNQKETQDLVEEIKQKTTSPYVFVSFYNQQTSKYILPITFDPEPDTYINYVFYLNNLSSPNELGYSPEEPKFDKPQQRKDFTAVEISVISQ